MRDGVRSLALLLVFCGAANARSVVSTEAPPRRLTAVETEAARSGVPFRQFSAWLEAFNSTGPTRIRSFLEQQWPSGKLDREMSLRDRSGGFELRALEEASATTLIGVMQERDSDQFARFTIVVEDAGARRITSLNRKYIPRPADFPVPRMSEPEIIAALRAKLEKDSAADRFAGTILVMRKGKRLFAHAYGLADREKSVANTLDTRFRMGSMNKMFTGTAVLQLVQAGKIQLNDPVG